MAMLGLIWLSHPTYAAQQDESKNFDELTWQLDLGASIQNFSGLIDSLDRQDSELSIGLLLSGGIYYDKFFLEASPFGRQPLTLGYTLRKTVNSQFNLVGLSWFRTISEAEQQQGNLLNGLNSRKQSAEIGLEYIKTWRSSDVRLRVLNDALGIHDGYVISLDYTRPIYTTDFLILPSIGGTLISEKSTDYYYGIKPDEATYERPEYRGRASWELTARLYIEHPVSENLTLFGFASYSKFSKGITDSPIVSAKNGTHTIALGVLWGF